LDTERRQWEEDLRLRQRNFVFPDTVRNEGNFYRTLLRGKRPLAGVHRIGLILLAIPFLLGGCGGLAYSIAQFFNPEDEFSRWLRLIVGGGIAVASCLFGVLMLFRALLSSPAPKPAGSAGLYKRPRNL